MREADIAYIAGLFDGEGSIYYKKGTEKKKKHKGKPGYRISNSWRINMDGVVYLEMRIMFVV